MNRRLIDFFALLVVFLMVVVPGPAFAHHGNTAYDNKNPITLKGTVTEFVWSNPHCQIYLDVKDDNGKAVNWGIESQSPGILRRNGWTHDSLKPGDQITITLIPSKNGAPVGFSGTNLGKVVLPDGQILKMDQR